MRSLPPKIIDKFFKTRSFTLVEVLISMLLGTIIAGAVIPMVYVFDFEQTDDITAARQRGEMVLAILENPVLHAGLGFPDSPDIFSDSDVVAEVAHGWPSDEVAIDNAVKDQGYRLVTVRGSWRIRN